MKKLIIGLLVLLIGFSAYVLMGNRSLDSLRKEEARLVQENESKQQELADVRREREEIEAEYARVMENNSGLEEELKRWKERTEQLYSLLN